MLYGGRNEDQALVFGDTWEWDGARRYTVSAPQVQSTSHTTITAFDGAGILVFLSSGIARSVWRGVSGAETCKLPFDVDGDTLSGCADPDCWFACTPLCTPEASCDATLPPYCGDQQCAPSENGFMCPADCAAPAAQCGNAGCEAEMTSCPGDCRP